MKYYIFLLLIFLTINCLSCQYQTVVIAQTEGGPKIVYWVNGGVSGRTDTVLIVNSNGVATSRFGYPDIDRALTDSEYQSIISLFDGFDTLSESYFDKNTPCRDQPYDHLVLRNDSSVKMVSIDQCGLREDSVAPDVKRLMNLIRVLWNLSKSIYKEDNTWKGVTVQYSTNKSVYLLDEPILINILIVNPTNVVKTLYFFHQEKFTFSVGATTPPYFLYHYPKRGIIDTTKPSQIVLQPNSQYKIEYNWEYVSDTSLTLVPTKYRIYLDLLAGQYENEFRLNEPIMIEITDSTVE